MDPLGNSLISNENDKESDRNLDLETNGSDLIVLLKKLIGI